MKVGQENTKSLLRSVSDEYYIISVKDILQHIVNLPENMYIKPK